MIYTFQWNRGVNSHFSIRRNQDLAAEAEERDTQTSCKEHDLQCCRPYQRWKNHHFRYNKKLPLSYVFKYQVFLQGKDLYRLCLFSILIEIILKTICYKNFMKQQIIKSSQFWIFIAWDDGKIRGYGFAAKDKSTSLVEKFLIEEAHSKGVTALACTSDGLGIVSGGGEGQVRIWKISKSYDPRGKDIVSLVETMMEHKGRVSDIKITRNDKECASASTDGTCIIWDLE